MTIVGLNYTGKLEIEWVPGSGAWTDVTADIVWSRGIRIKVGRSSEFDDAQPGELTVSLYNESLTNTTGNYTPDNPLSAYYPNVAKGRRIRFTITYSAVSYVRFLGRIKVPEADALDQGRATVTISAIDSLGAMAQRTLSADWVEQWMLRSATETADVWPMDDDVSASTFRNAGSGVGVMSVVGASSNVGSYQRGSVDQGYMLPGQLTLSPASGTFIGPVLAVDLGRSLGTNAVATFTVKTSQTVASGDLVIATALDSSGVALWSIRLHPNAGNTVLWTFDEVGGVSYIDALNNNLNGSDKWLGISFYDDGSRTNFYLNNGADGIGYSTLRSTTVRYLVIGGRVTNWKLLGKQTLCTPLAVAGVGAASASITDLIDHARPLVTTTSASRAGEIVSYCGLTRAGSGFLVPQVSRTDSTGRNALDCLVQVMGTVTGATWHEYSTDRIQTAWPDVARPRTSTATIAIEADDDASTPFTWRGAGDSRPTRVTVSSAFGSKTAVDAFSEAQGLRQEETWASCAGSVLTAGALAGARLNRSIGARIPQLPVDLVTAANGSTLFPAVMAVRPGYRLTVTGLPSTKLGVTQVDVYAMGWTETWTETKASFVFDVQPADRPAELVLDDGTYGRLSAGTDASGVPLMKVTSGTAVGATGNGTLVVTTSAGPALTMDAAAYPLDLDWNGERVTITAAPASSTSPQTVTTTARGVAPTVARAHGTGEGIDVWLTPTIAGV